MVYCVDSLLDPYQTLTVCRIYHYQTITVCRIYASEKYLDSNMILLERGFTDRCCLFHI